MSAVTKDLVSTFVWEAEKAARSMGPFPNVVDFMKRHGIQNPADFIRLCKEVEKRGDAIVLLRNKGRPDPSEWFVEVFHDRFRTMSFNSWLKKKGFQRKCISCRQNFMPDHFYNFICPSCNEKNSYHRGMFI